MQLEAPLTLMGQGEGSSRLHGYGQGRSVRRPTERNRPLDPRTITMLYFLKRLAFAVPLMLLISFLAFELMHVAPGGPFDKERAPASPEIKRALEAKFHLNEPVGQQ